MKAIFSSKFRLSI